MSASSRTRHPVASIALALTGIGVAAILAVAAHAVAARFGLIAGVILIGGAFAGCGLVDRRLPRRDPEPARPAGSLPVDAGMAA